MGMTDMFLPTENSRRLQRSILFFVILATLPCYCVGAILLGVAPNEEDDIVETTALPTQVATLITPTGTIDASITPIPSATDPLQSTPGQFIPATSTQFILPSATNTPTPTNTATPTMTLTPSVTPTNQTNENPTFDSLPGNISVGEGSTQTGSFTASDPDGDTLNFTLTVSNTAIATAAKTGNTFEFQITGVSAGSTSMIILVEDGKGGSIQTSINITVTDVNQNPVFNAQPSNQTINVGQNQNVSLNISDPDGDTIVASASSSNVNVATVSASGSQLTVVGIGAGTATITVNLDDGRGGTAQTTFSVTVDSANQNPVFNAQPSNQTVAVGGNKQVNINVSDPNGDPITLTATSANTGIVTTSVVDSDTFSISGVSVGITTVTLNLSDGKGGTAQTSVQVTVSASNQNPVFNVEPTPISVNQGDSTLVILQFSDPNGDPVTFTAVIADTNVATRTIVDGTSFSVTGQNVGNTTVTVTLSDGKGGTAQRVININVLAP